MEFHPLGRILWTILQRAAEKYPFVYYTKNIIKNLKLKFHVK